MVLDQGRRLFIESKFVLGVEPVPAWAMNKRCIHLVMVGDRCAKAVVYTQGGPIIAYPGDQIALDRQGGMHVFARPPFDAA